MDLGWINKFVPEDDLDAEVERWCAEIVAKSLLYMGIAKANSNVMHHQMSDNMIQSLGALFRAIGSADMRDGVNAFMENRKSQFPCVTRCERLGSLSRQSLANSPPSMTKQDPVTKSESGETRYAARGPISCGSAIRRPGIFRNLASRVAGSSSTAA